jgi:hypothetical protein
MALLDLVTLAVIFGVWLVGAAVLAYGVGRVLAEDDRPYDQEEREA